MTKRRVEVIGVMSGTFFQWDMTVTIIAAALNRKCVLKLVMVFENALKSRKNGVGGSIWEPGDFTALAFLSVH